MIVKSMVCTIAITAIRFIPFVAFFSSIFQIHLVQTAGGILFWAIVFLLSLILCLEELNRW